MLDYISKQLQQRMGVDDSEAREEQQLNEAVLEYAHITDALTDLTMEGTNVDSARPYTKLNIPLEDDPEITSVEMNLLDGRVTDIPMDATAAQEAMLYTRMKTLDEFVTEAYNSTTQYARETDGEYNRRVESIAEAAYAQYKDKVIQEGLFGFDKMSMTDKDIPAKLTLTFGKMNGKEYTVKLPVKFEVDKKHRILKKQLHSIHKIQNEEAKYMEQLEQIVYSQLREQAGIESPEEVWDKITPVEIVVPIEPSDHYCVAFGFEIDAGGKNEYIVWSEPIKAKANKGVEFVEAEKIPALNTETKAAAVQEMANAPRPRLTRFVQEAIDFGEPDAAPDANDGAPSVSVDAAPAPDANADTTANPDELPADGSDIGAPAEGDAPKEEVNTNDVSDQIAEKVADDTAADSGDENDINIDDLNISDDQNNDTTDTPSDEELNADLGDEGSTEEVPAEGDTTDTDIDNMTIDELLAQGTERLKGMTIQQLRDFLGSGETPTGDTELPAEEATQEAFFLTRGNIGKELDIHLRKALGILNNDEMEINDLCRAFRKEGKQLNRVLHKAAKMKKVFGEAEIKQLQRTNHTLSDLIAMMRTNIDQNSVMVVKRLIQAFVQDAKAVAILIERSKEEHVQEAFTGKPYKGKRPKEELFRGLNDDRAKLLKKFGLFGKIFGKKDPETSEDIAVGDTVKFKKNAYRYSSDGKKQENSPADTKHEWLVWSVDYNSGHIPQSPDHIQLKLKNSQYYVVTDKQCVTVVRRHDQLPESFPISSDQLNKILTIIEDKTKKPCARLTWSKTKTNQDDVTPTSSVVGGLPPFIGEIPVDNGGKQLRFVIQINFADINGIPELPSNGIVQFWCDRFMETWSGDKKQSDSKYRVLYYSPEDMKTKDRTSELRDQIDTSIYKDKNSTYCFGDQTDIHLISFSKEENCLAPWSWDEIDDYKKIFMDTWNDVVSDPEKKIKDVKEAYNILKMIQKGFSDQIDSKGIFDQYGWKIGGYPGFIQSDFRKYVSGNEFTSDNTFLLLQLDEGPTMWGDCGTAQIFITKEALAKRDFSKAIFDWACY